MTFTMLHDAMGLDVRRVDDVFGARRRGQVPERTVHEHHVVVDSFGDADNGDLQVAPFHFFGDGMRTALGAIVAEGEQNVDATLLEEIDDDVGLTGREEPSRVPPR
jgi:hypothetical protein